MIMFFEVRLEDGVKIDEEIVKDIVKLLKNDKLPQIKEIVDFLIQHNWEIYFIWK